MFTVKAIDGSEEKSLQEKEADMLAQAEQENNASQETEENKENQNTEETKAIQYEVTDNDVLSYIKTKHNKELNSIEDLFKEKEVETDIPFEDVKTFLKYKKETGRGIEDFVKLNKDYDKVDENSLLLDYYRELNPELESDDLQFELNEKFDYDEDYDEEKVIKSKKLAKKKELAKAKEYFNNLKEQYKTPLESRESFIPAEEKESYDAFKRSTKEASDYEADVLRKQTYFTQKTNELFDNNFEGFEFSVDDKKILYKVADPKSVKEKQSSISNFISSFLNEEGLLRDPKAYHKALSIASDPDGYAKFFYELGKSEGVTEVTKSQKNIDMSTTTSASQSQTKQSGAKVRAVGDSGDGRLRIKIKNV